MANVETIEEFYRKKFDWIPDNLKSEIGHFNVFKLDPITNNLPQSIPYKRRDFYKIMLVRGNSKVHYADKVVEVKNQALSFSNPQIPYKWEHLNNVREGAYCIFNQAFFHQYGNLNQYAVFQPGGLPILEVSDLEYDKIAIIYDKIFNAIKSDYQHKYDLLRNLVFELLHFAMQMKVNLNIVDAPKISASQRISTMFIELLERQFPIDENHITVELRTASDFAKQLNVHVNHLNRAVKEITEKTTSNIIADRILQEAKIMLKHSEWNVSEIAHALGFTEVSHFNNFFKNKVQTSPLKYRNQ
jgi:AraC family transcriptional activator of pobA